MRNRFHPKGYLNPQQLKALHAKQTKQNRPVVSFMTDKDLKKAIKRKKFTPAKCGYCSHIIKTENDYYNHTKKHLDKGDLR